MEKPAAVDYVERLVLSMLECHGCKQVMQGSVQITVDTEQQLHDLATALHKASNIICHTPRFVLHFQTVLTDTRLIPAAPVAETTRRASH